MPRLPTYFLSHGGGPWPYMKVEFGNAFDKLEASLRYIVSELGQPPRAVLVVSGHWEAETLAVSSSPTPPMIYDYHGFPAHTYNVVYPAPGSPTVASEVMKLLNQGGIACVSDPARGFDHGTFSMLQPMYPKADVPVVQLSLKEGYDPDLHIAVGRLLSPLRDDGVLIIGSGSSYHDLRNRGPQAKLPSNLLDEWLQDTLVRSSPAERVRRLEHWTAAPSARRAHPQEDHLLPLMVAAGAAEGDSGRRVYHNDIMGAATSGFRFG